MKSFVLIFFLSWSTFSFQQSNSKRSVRIVLMNDVKSRPIATDIIFFWTNKAFLDTIDLNSERFYSFVKDRINLLNREKFDYNFTVSAAVLLNDNHKIDTFYTDQFFRNWKIQGKCYSDSTGELRKMFGNLFLFQYY